MSLAVRPRRALCLGLAALAVGLLLPRPAQAGKGDRLPYDVGFWVEYDAEARGPESWRKDFEFMVVDYLQSLGCFQTILRWDDDVRPETELLLFLKVLDVEDSQRYDVAQKDLYGPGSTPDSAVSHTVILRAGFELSLRKMPESIPVRWRRFRLTSSYRPKLGEDARYQVRLQMIADVEEEIVRLLCKGNEKKLAKEIDKALLAPR